MKWEFCLLLLMSYLAVNNCIEKKQAIAQVTSDGTTNTTVNHSGNEFIIEDGDRAGSNLFHSFQDFSVPTNGSAIFNNAEAISNIFSRVTGGNISSIDGLIRANGSANLFLINPAGIIFGEGASLDVGGSFYGSTADSILFPDGEFSAIAPDNTPILTINAPIGLSFRDNPPPISLTGNLTVNTGQNFNLIGGQIELNNGNVTVTQGSIDLLALSQAEAIAIETTEFETANIEFANINLNNFVIQVASSPASSVNNGNINITAKTLSLANESRLINATLGDRNAGDINVSVSDSVLINTNSAIFANTFAEGDAGNINIKADNAVTLEGTNRELTGIFSGANLDESISNNLAGDAGNISVEAERISITKGALIDSSTFGSGDAGDIALNAEAIALEGDNSSIFSAVGSLNLNTRATGNGGAIDIQTQSLSLSDGATIVTQTFGAGSAGAIDINASEAIAITGVASFPFLENGEPGGFSSGLFSNSETEATGSGGEIRVTTPLLQIDDGGVINARSRGSASAGNIIVNAENLEITDGSQILTTSFANGSAGNINLNVAERISISGIDPDFANRLNSLIETFGEEEARFSIDPVSADSGLFASTTSSPVTGTSGEITITVGELLELRDGSLISARASGNADGGNINIDAENGLIIAFPSADLGGDIVASAPEGKGGNITIRSEGVLGLEENIAFDDAGNRASNGSNDLDATGAVTGTVEIITPDLDPFQGTLELSEAPVESEQVVTQACVGAESSSASLVLKGKGGIPPEPTAPLSSHDLILGGNTLSSNTNNTYESVTDNGRSQNVITYAGEQIVPARGVEITEDGRVLLVGYPTDNTQRHTVDRTDCSQS